MLAEHPVVLSRLRQEILEKIGPQRRPTYDDFRDMKFLKAVINGALCCWLPPCRLFIFETETLRLYPVVYVVLPSFYYLSIDQLLFQSFQCQAFNGHSSHLQSALILLTRTSKNMTTWLNKTPGGKLLYIPVNMR